MEIKVLEQGLIETSGNPRQIKGRNIAAFIKEQRGLTLRSTYVIEDELS